MEDGNCMFLQNSLIVFMMLSEQYALLICWYNLLGILKKKVVCSSEKFVIFYQATFSHFQQNRILKVTAVNILCAVLNVNHNLFLHECTVLCSLLIG